MKFFKWKIFLITSAVCLLPIIFGLYLWNSLPEVMPIHFNIYGEPDNYASKSVVVFVLPILMVVAQAYCCFINDINEAKHGERRKFELVTKWIIPCLTVTLQAITLGYGLGCEIDVSKAVCIIVGVMFLFIGNYLPKFDYIKNHDVDTEKARKINRFIGFETVILGLLFLISAFLSPKVKIICLFLLIPYAIISVVYGIIVGRK